MTPPFSGLAIPERHLEQVAGIAPDHRQGVARVAFEKQRGGCAWRRLRRTARLPSVMSHRRAAATAPSRRTADRDFDRSASHYTD